MDVIAYDYERDLDPIKSKLQMDVPKMQEKVLMNPMEKILNAFKMVPNAAIRGGGAITRSTGCIYITPESLVPFE